MRLTIFAALTMFLTACTNLPNEVAICDGTQAMRKDHARALLDDGGPKSQETGVRLLVGMKAGCNE